MVAFVVWLKHLQNQCGVIRSMNRTKLLAQIKEIDAITLAVDTNTWKTSSCVNYYIIFKYYPTFDKSIIQRLIKVLSNV